jgi:hypothetical protein
MDAVIYAITFRGIALHLNDADLIILKAQRGNYVNMMKYKQISHDFKNMLKDYAHEIDTIFAQVKKGGANG